MSCNTCNKSDAELLKCGRCQSVHYCNRECQKLDWKNHKVVCHATITSIRKEIQDTILAIKDNPKFNGLLRALLHYWFLTSYKNGYLSCYIRNSKKNFNGKESFYESGLIYLNPETDPNDKLNPKGRNVSIIYKDNRLEDNYGKVVISFSADECRTSYNTMKGHINFKKITQPLSVSLSDFEFCAFGYGTELISL